MCSVVVLRFVTEMQRMEKSEMRMGSGKAAGDQPRADFVRRLRRVFLAAARQLASVWSGGTELQSATASDQKTANGCQIEGETVVLVPGS
ncbi:hypothetical protein GUJ93_ZPchr0013g36124 [Zizania palustris]|uniref:Uncharacterized protein n=1 Tax=Zizania palustris TaxID=103762 RepID=A0A8J6BYY9_ZIZPA|nr:hypothetical protein GUJ93_ZPchr0013g36124 [Zizania palustris]